MWKLPKCDRHKFCWKMAPTDYAKQGCHKPSICRNEQKHGICEVQ